MTAGVAQICANLCHLTETNKRLFRQVARVFEWAQEYPYLKSTHTTYKGYSFL